MASEAALAEALRQDQARIAARVQAALKVAFDRHAGTDREAYERLALRVLGAGHGQSAAAAAEYYAQSRLAAGLEAIALPIEPVVFDTEAAATSLRINNEVLFRSKIVKGFSVAEARAAALTATLRYAKRAALGGARETISRTAAKDKDVVGVARIADGSPCAFCSMLAARGPVYTAATAKFRAHDGCGCLPRPVYGKGDDGWSKESRRYRQIYEDTRDGKILDENGNPLSFRAVIDRARKAA